MIFVLIFLRFLLLKYYFLPMYLCRQLKYAQRCIRNIRIFCWLCLFFIFLYKNKRLEFLFSNLGFFVLWFVWLSTAFGQPFFKPKVTRSSTPIFHGQQSWRFLTTSWDFWVLHFEHVFLTSPFLTFSVCFCRKDCFTNLYFKGCVELLLLTDESKEIFQMVETVGRKWGRTF